MSDKPASQGNASLSPRQSSWSLSDPAVQTPLLICAGVLVVVLLGHAAWAQVKLTAPKRAARKRNERAARGERNAEALCESRGYRVLAVQPEYAWHVLVDGARRQVKLRPDLLVEKKGRRYLADVKTGNVAPDPLYPATRRQLLEYLVACGADGVLVVDVEAKKILALEFPLGGETPPSGASEALRFIVTLLAGGVLGALAVKWFL